MESNKHPVKYNSCNIGEILDVPVDIPLNPLYSPVLSVYVYDHVLGLIGTRLIGISHIPLSKIVRRTLRGFLERRHLLGYKEKDSFEKSVQFVELSKRMISKKRKDLEGGMRDEAHLNKSLNRLQIMIDKGQVELNSVVSGVTEENAIEDIVKDMQKREKEAEGNLRAMEIAYEFTDEDYQDLEDFLEDSDEEESDEEESSEEISSYSRTPRESQRESTVRSNDINLGFEEDDSEESEEEEESKSSSEYSRIKEKRSKKSKKSRK